jgi:hypothetical protein
MLLRRLDVPVIVWRTPSAATTRSYLRTSILELRRPLSRRGRHLSAARPAPTWPSFAGPGRDPSREFSEIWKPRAVGDWRGASLAQLSRCGMTTPVLTSGEATENMAIAAGKGPKTQKIGLKEQAPALVQRISDSASSHIACGSYRSATQGARGRRPQASRVSSPPVPVLTPREGSGRQTRQALRRPPIRPRLLTHDPHRDQRRGVRGDCPNAPSDGGGEHMRPTAWLVLMLAAPVGGDCLRGCRCNRGLTCAAITKGLEAHP